MNTGRSGDAFVVDQSQFPVVVVRSFHQATSSEFEAYLAQLDAVYQRREKFALILDATESAGADAAQRRRQADWMRDNAEVIARYNVGTAFVIPSAVVRGILTAILWMQPMPSPHHVCSDLREAREWCRARLAETGVVAAG